MINVFVMPKIAFFLAISLTPGSSGFLDYQSEKSPANVSECLRMSISRDLIFAKVSKRYGIYIVTDESGFSVEIGKSISSNRTLIRLQTRSRVISDEKYLQKIRSCL